MTSLKEISRQDNECNPGKRPFLDEVQRTKLKQKAE